MIIYKDKVLMFIADDNGETDDYGRPKVKEVETIAHVRYKQTNIFNANGEQTTSNALVYIPYASNKVANIDIRPRFYLKTPNGNQEIGKAVRVEYGQAVTGTPMFIKYYIG